MPRLELDLKISIGNIITILTVIGAAITAWFTVLNTQALLAQKISAIEAAISAGSAERNAQLAAQENRLRALEILDAGRSADMRAIQSSLSRIETRIEKLTGTP